MHKIVTKLSMFRFNHEIINGIITVTWYVVERGSETEEGRCFTYDELTQFLSFINSRPKNFPGEKNYSICSEEELTPSFELYSYLPDNRLHYPTHLVLSKTPSLENRNEICEWMDIVLIGEIGVDDHSYNLDFDVVGKIENLF